MRKAEASPRTIEDAQAVAGAAKARMHLMASALREIQIAAEAGGPDALKRIHTRSTFALEQQDWITASSS